MPSARACYLYEIQHIQSGKLYVGISIDPERRWHQHCVDSAKSSYYLHNALRKYGKDAFTWTVVGEYASEDLAKLAEVETIASYKQADVQLYNETAGGEGAVGMSPRAAAAHRAALKKYYQDNPHRKLEVIAAARTWCDKPENKLVTSAASKERWSKPEFRQRTVDAQRVACADPVNMARKSATKKKLWQDPEFAARQLAMREAAGSAEKSAKGNRERWADPEFYARRSVELAEARRRPEVRARNSASQKANWADPEYRAAHPPRPCTAETKAKLRAARTGKKIGPLSPEAREKISTKAMQRSANPELVSKIRELKDCDGKTFTQIGHILGISRSQAHLRYQSDDVKLARLSRIQVRRGKEPVHGKA